MVSPKKKQPQQPRRKRVPALNDIEPAPRKIAKPKPRPKKAVSQKKKAQNKARKASPRKDSIAPSTETEDDDDDESITVQSRSPPPKEESVHSPNPPDKDPQNDEDSASKIILDEPESLEKQISLQYPGFTERDIDAAEALIMLSKEDDALRRRRIMRELVGAYGLKQEF